MNKRDPIKHIRDKAKKAYEKKSECDICGTTENLQLHHYTGLTELFNLWTRKKCIRINTDEDVLAVRDRFIEEHQKELYEDVATLCKKHHMELHSLFGKAPVFTSAIAQAKWVKKKHELVSKTT